MYTFYCLSHLGLLFLLLLAADIEVNPGPRAPKDPCGVCTKAVKWKERGVACDSCETWFHASCMHMPDEIYIPLANLSWTCCQCGLPNFSSDLFASATSQTPSTHPSLQDISSESSLSSPLRFGNAEDQIGHPLSHSSPINDDTSGQKRPDSCSSSTISLEAGPIPIKANQVLRTLTINFQSVKNKRAELLNLLQSTDPDFVIGTETWLKPSIQNAEIFPPTYNVYRKDRLDDNGYGGVLVAVKANLISHQITIDPSCETELVLVEVQTEQRNSPLLVGSLYRPPRVMKMEAVSNILGDLDVIQRAKDSVVWIGGDLNLPDVDWRSNDIIGHKYPKQMNQAFIDKLSDLGLQQVNLEQTRGESLLDVFFTNRPNLVKKTTLIPGISDHDIALSDNYIRAPRIKPPPRMVSIWKNANIDAIKQDTKTFSSELLSTNHSNTPVEVLWNMIHGHLTSMMEKHVPTKLMSTKFHQPWIDNKLKKASRRKYRAWKKAKNTGKEKDWKRYKTIKAETRRINRQAYYKYVNTLVTEDNNKNLWRFIKSRKCDATGVAPLKTNGITISDSKRKADILNDQFCSVFTREDTIKMPDPEPSPHPTMPDIEINAKGISKLLRNLNPRKAAGPDGIPCRLLQMVAEELAPALTLLFSQSLYTSQIPSAWKHALIQPVFKKGDRSQACNYRPISLTCVCCKILEHVVRADITRHLERNGIISDVQHGFRKGRSCETQLLLTVDDLATELDRGGQTDAILLDFSKAFDRVPHQRLLMKLHQCGIRGRTQSWIRNFLSDRTQQVVVDGEKSSLGQVVSGVPQGSVLGPSLFLIYINDIGDNVSSQIRLFADDTILYSSIQCPADTARLQQDLSRLEEWESKWQMGFNVSKCHVLRVTRKRKPVLKTYTLHQQPLETVRSAKYLGVELSCDLNWRTHIQAVTAKANKTSAFVSRNLKGCPTQVQSHCYKALVRPVLEYSSPVWDPHSKSHIESIEAVQRRTARRILRDFSRTSSATALVARLKLNSLQLRRRFSKAVLMYKIMNGLLDCTPRPGTFIHSNRPSRGQPQKIRVPHSRTDTHLHSFFPSAIRVWNDLPPETTRTTSLADFKSQLEGWVYQQQ